MIRKIKFGATSYRCSKMRTLSFKFDNNLFWINAQDRPCHSITNVNNILFENMHNIPIDLSITFHNRADGNDENEIVLSIASIQCSIIQMYSKSNL